MANMNIKVNTGWFLVKLLESGTKPWSSEEANMALSALKTYENIILEHFPDARVNSAEVFPTLDSCLDFAERGLRNVEQQALNLLHEAQVKAPSDLSPQGKTKIGFLN